MSIARTLSTALALLILPFGTPAAAAQVAGEWTVLPLPSLASESPAPLQLLRLEQGHALVDDDDDDPREMPTAAHLNPANLLGLLQSEIALRGLDVELQPSAPPLVARGQEADLAHLERVLGDLDRAGRALDIRLDVWFEQPGSAALDASGFASIAAREPHVTATIRSGQSISFGASTQTPYLTGFDVEVATDSGVAAPETTTAVTGRVLHLRACRVQGGAAVHLEGNLTASELASAESYDPGTPDLGILEQPELRVAQVLFSDVIGPDSFSAVHIGGSVNGWADGTVWIRATTTLTPSAADSSELTWRLFDLALAEHALEGLPFPSPGAGAGLGLDVDELQLGRLQPFSAAQLAAASSTGQRGSPTPAWAPGLLLVPAGGPEARSARNLLAAVEAERLQVERVSVSQGTLRIDLPTAASQPARILYGTESVRLVAYDAHIAAESWMPVPKVRRSFDGLCVQGRWEHGNLNGIGWVAGTDNTRLLERSRVGVGGLQLPERTLECRPFTLRSTDSLNASGNTLGSSRLQLGAASTGLTLQLGSN